MTSIETANKLFDKVATIATGPLHNFAGRLRQVSALTESMRDPLVGDLVPEDPRGLNLLDPHKKIEQGLAFAAGELDGLGDRLELTLQKQEVAWRLTLALAAVGSPTLATACMNTTEDTGGSVAIVLTEERTNATLPSHETAIVPPTIAEPTVTIPTATFTPEPAPTTEPTSTPEPTATVEVDAAMELAQGLEAFAASPVAGQLEMVYSVHPEIQVNPEPAKNLYNYFIEVVTTSKGFESYWQALGLYDHASIMNYLETNNYRVPTEADGVYFPNARITNGIIVTGQETDWKREGGGRLATIDLGKLGLILIDDGIVREGRTQIEQLFGPNKIFYLGYGMGFSFRFFQFGDSGVSTLIIKESMAESGTLPREDASLKGNPKANPEYPPQLTYQLATVLRYMGTSDPNRAEANNCGRPGQTEINQRGMCIPDNAAGIQDPHFLGANHFTAERLGLTDLFTVNDSLITSN